MSNPTVPAPAASSPVDDSTTASVPPAETVAEAPPIEEPSVAAAPSSVEPDAAWSPEEWKANVGWAIGVTATIFLMFCALRFLPSIGWPLVVAVAFAYLFDPVVCALERRGLGRTAGTSAILGLGALLGAGALLALIPVLIAQARSLPRYVRRAVEVGVPKLESLTGLKGPESLDELAFFAQEHVQELVGQVLPGAGSAVGKIIGGSLSVASFVVAALVVPVVGFYLLQGWPEIVASVRALVPPRHREVVVERMKSVDRVLGGFVRGQLTLSLVLSVLYAAALSIVGLKLALVVALITGFGNLVPYVGTAVGVALAVGFALVDFGIDARLGFVVGTYVVLGAAESVFISPRLVGDRVGLSSAVVIVAVMTCGALFGFAGILLAVPAAGVLKLVAQVAERAWTHSRTFTGEAPSSPAANHTSGPTSSAQT